MADPTRPKPQKIDPDPSLYYTDKRNLLVRNDLFSPNKNSI